jgi:hypothetical protein
VQPEEEDAKVVAAAPTAKGGADPDEVTDRPRKKKKKKKQESKTLLLLLLGLSGAVLIGIIILVIVQNLPSKERPKGTEQAKQEPPKPEVQQPPEKEPEKGRVGRGPRAAADQQIIQNDLRQLALFWNTYRTENGKPPRDWKTFKPYLRTAGNIVEGLEEGKYRIVLQAQPASNAVLAYEWPQDDTGQHIVAMGDGSVDRILHQELLKLVPNAGKEPLK